MAAGIFGEQKVELVAGKIYVMTDLPPHTFAVGRYHGCCGRCYPKMRGRFEKKSRSDRASLGTQADISVLRGGDILYAARHPRPGDVTLAGRGCRHDLLSRSRSEMASLRRGGNSDLHHRPSQGPRHVYRGLDRPHWPGVRARYTDVIRYSARAGESVPDRDRRRSRWAKSP